MKQKWISILISGLLLIGCLTGCNNGVANSSEPESTSPSSTQAPGDTSSSEGENSGEEISVPVFDFESRTVMLNSGYEMPIAGLGTYALSDEECYNSVTALLEAGGRLIDTASYYGNEEAVGRAVRDSDVPREEIFVTTKIYPTEFDDPEAAIEGCLERLDIGYIDLMLLHHPGSGDVEAYHAMEQAVADGKIRSIGLSNWYIEELEEFLPQVNITPAVVQNEIHPYYQEQEVVPYIQKLGIVVNGYHSLTLARAKIQNLFSCDKYAILCLSQCRELGCAGVLFSPLCRAGMVATSSPAAALFLCRGNPAVCSTTPKRQKVKSFPKNFSVQPPYFLP